MEFHNTSKATPVTSLVTQTLLFCSAGWIQMYYVTSSSTSSAVHGKPGYVNVIVHWLTYYILCALCNKKSPEFVQQTISTVTVATEVDGCIDHELFYGARTSKDEMLTVLNGMIHK